MFHEPGCVYGEGGSDKLSSCSCRAKDKIQLHFPQEYLEHLKKRVGIRTIIGLYIKEAKHSIATRCPFCRSNKRGQDTFIINENRNTAVCIDCRMGGTVFNFMMDYHNCSFSEAVKWFRKPAQDFTDETYRTTYPICFRVLGGDVADIRTLKNRVIAYRNAYRRKLELERLFVELFKKATDMRSLLAVNNEINLTSFEVTRAERELLQAALDYDEDEIEQSRKR